MSDKRINRIIALGVFLASAFVYMKTLSVTVVFWDVGEFCAASRLLEVPHPPGSPLFTLIARLVSLVPFLPDIAARMHAISAVGSALGIMFLYLTGVKVIGRFHSTETAVDRLIVRGSSAIGAFALAFSTTYWDNAIEAEVYGLGMFFASFCIWLALRWWERADEPHNEKYLLLIAYVIGLSTGVHILSVLVAFPVLMIVYFRKYEFSRDSFIKFGFVAVGIFFVIYPGIVQLLPSFLDGDFKGFKSELLPFIPLLCILAAAYGAYRTIESKQKMLHIACLSFLLIVLCYTTYAQVLIRSNVDNLPMKENNPSNLTRLTSYLTREQYGETPLLKGESWDNETQAMKEKLFPRRWSREAMHEPTRVNYTSDADFFWRYQVNHMFIRYVLWNFVGSEGDWQDAGVSWKDTSGIPLFIPLLLAIVGVYYQFKKDWKMGLVFASMFIIMGIVLDLYQNQQDPQPRERDYFYVGAYYCVALWIGVGIAGIADFLRDALKQSPSYKPAVAGVLAVAMLAVPVNMIRTNWHDHDRSQNYIAWDYSYNLLQSCEPNSILFTNGDNDTFPLWYLQDVEAVRRDVRIVNLSLVNTNWYIHALKNEKPFGTKEVPISLTNAQIEGINPVLWKPRQIDIPFSPAVAQRFGVSDTSVLHRGKISFALNGINIAQDTRILRVQDLMVRDIILTNKWERPIHFAVTCSPDSKIGLDNYLWMRGLVYTLKPMPTPGDAIGGLEQSVMEENVMGLNVNPTVTPQNGFRYRNLNNTEVYYDENVQRMVMNYRASFLRLAYHALRNQNDVEKARKVMQRMEEVMPVNVIKNQDWRLTADIMGVFNQVGDSVNFNKYSQIVESICQELISAGNPDPNDPFMPYRYLVDLYDARKDYGSALATLQSARSVFGSVPDLETRIRSYEQRVKGTPPDTNTPKTK
ncbi:MAG TPA: DUF2723 domain-containing protein [Bacteroidota bacterium]|jgi:hypothetical protein|nr:DUF2723 domain-containing protein [Bacteroidota bacterium]